ncbi:hypothetical protein HAX54_018277 [Datura stramonium]|uniref:Uncharacterized protein n=1 Tax=Datura stramonium TaxID=4076 RepID=A0ABS8S151_DATST|nr:hypothetical protein [Datura stramonium]
MNIVKGVAGLIRRSSVSHGGESSSGSPLERFSPPTPLIHFRKTCRELPDELVCDGLWWWSSLSSSKKGGWSAMVCGFLGGGRVVGEVAVEEILEKVVASTVVVVEL